MAGYTNDGDDIDTEALQAQLDISMSFAHDLVSSWIKPTQTVDPNLRESVQNDQDLEDYMRRPPRLGVGAPIPETTHTSQETAILKSRLTGQTGKKRVRKDEDSLLRLPSDDEEESRAGAIKKKPRLDPFTVGNRSKNKETRGAETATPQFSTPRATTQVSVKNNDDEPSVSLLNGVPDSPSASGTPKRKKKNLIKARDVVLPSIAAPSKNEIQSSPSTPRYAAKQHPSHNQEASPHAANGFLNLPLLNLDGPPSYAQIDEDEGLSSVTASPRKKKRRRKKKTFPSVTST